MNELLGIFVIRSKLFPLFALLNDQSVVDCVIHLIPFYDQLNIRECRIKSDLQCNLVRGD